MFIALARLIGQPYLCTFPYSPQLCLTLPQLYSKATENYLKNWKYGSKKKRVRLPALAKWSFGAIKNKVTHTTRTK